VLHLKIINALYYQVIFSEGEMLKSLRIFARIRALNEPYSTVLSTFKLQWDASRESGEARRYSRPQGGGEGGAFLIQTIAAFVSRALHASTDRWGLFYSISWHCGAQTTWFNAPGRAAPCVPLRSTKRDDGAFCLQDKRLMRERNSFNHSRQMIEWVTINIAWLKTIYLHRNHVGYS